MSTMIEVENLTKYYGPVLAVDRISFSVEEGQIVGFLGPNGAGKSTTLKILTCFLPATSGSAYVAGLSVFRDPLKVRQNVGYLPENVPLYPEMRVGAYLKFRARVKGIAPADRTRAVESAAERCRLTAPMNVMRRRIDQLSKGYRQRLGLADAILNAPPVLVLDEPTIGLDPTQIRETRTLIQELGRDHTVILSSHILAEVEQTCERIVMLAGGKLVAQGTPGELRDRVSEGLKLVVEARGAEPGTLGEELGKVPGVRSVSIDDGSGGWTRLLLTPEAGQDPRAGVYKVAATSGWQLREIRRESASLEDFFVQAALQSVAAGQ